MVSTEAARPATSTTLAHRVIGPLEEPSSQHVATRRVTLVHGFAQNGACLGPLLDHLALERTVVAVDAPGHGGSLTHATADLWTGAELLVATAGRCDLVGYSMGARLSLHAALRSPEQVDSLVLIGGTAGIDDDAERAQRRESDELLARRLERDGLDRFVEQWLDLPMFAGLPTWARFDAERRTNTVEGLAASLRAAGTGAMDPLWTQLDAVRCPVLCITGERDERYGTLAEQIVELVGGPARHLVIEGAGHAAHLERPDETSAAVTEFLSSRRD